MLESNGGARMRRAILLASIICVSLVSYAAGGTWYVKPDGTGDIPTIQAAVDTVAPGDTVLLASGTYTGTGNHDILVPDKQLVIVSETGDPADCIIDCQGYLDNNRRAFNLGYSPSTRVIRGITIRNGIKDLGGGIYCDGNITMRDCVLESNTGTWWGGAIAFSEFAGDVKLVNCIFISNEATDPGLALGGRLVIQNNNLYLTIDSCDFYYNSAHDGGAIGFYANEGATSIAHSLFVGNTASSGGGGVLVSNAEVDIDCCTFHANQAPVGSGIYTGTWSHFWDYSMTEVSNCIIAYGIGGNGYHQWHYNPADPSFQCNNVYGNEGGDYADSLVVRLGVDGNFSACPSFCNHIVEPYDLSLCDQSPCLPGNHPDGYDCGIIGAFGEGCICDPTRTEPSTWGAIKAMYR